MNCMFENISVEVLEQILLKISWHDQLSFALTCKKNNYFFQTLKFYFFLRVPDINEKNIYLRVASIDRKLFSYFAPCQKLVVYKLPARPNNLLNSKMNTSVFEILDKIRKKTKKSSELISEITKLISVTTVEENSNVKITRDCLRQY